MDKNVNSNGYPNRVGKVWPDLKIVTFDDEEIIVSWVWNLIELDISAKLGLIVPNTCNDNSADDEGLLSGSYNHYGYHRFNSTLHWIITL